MANDYVEKIDLDGEQWDLKDSPLSEQVGNLQRYSTTEINTGMRWIDDKPIYRRVVDFGTLPNNGVKNVRVEIANLDKIISIRGYTSNGRITSPLPYPALTSTNVIRVAYEIDNQVLTMTTGTNRTDYTDTKVILEYTKTTN